MDALVETRKGCGEENKEREREISGRVGNRKFRSLQKKNPNYLKTPVDFVGEKLVQITKENRRNLIFSINK